QGWSLNGNIGLDTTAYIGTRDSVDVVLKSNGANNPQPQLKLKASGGVEVNGPAILKSNVNIPNLQEATDPNQEFKLVSIGNDGILKSGPSFKPGSGCSPTFGWGNVYNQFATYTNDIIKCPAIGNVGIGITTLPQAKLHVLGNFKLDGEIEITGSRLHVDNNSGNIGIGTSDPNNQLHIFGNNPVFNIQPSNWGNGNYSQITLGDNNHTIKSTFGEGLLITDINKVKINSPRIVLGNQEITNGEWGNAQLYISGTAVAKEIFVKVDGWADYVFEKGYQLPTLFEVSKYIEEYKHLPGIPSATEVDENGISLGEMNKMLLKKLEELTLYLLELDKANVEMKERLKKVELELKGKK
ncbi:MAG: hypothetical protein K1X82_14110, partial [Bacteroidia bacterium]|nr:hypothetical protein [Bacteroidia bacterium]